MISREIPYSSANMRKWASESSDGGSERMMGSGSGAGPIFLLPSGITSGSKKACGSKISSVEFDIGFFSSWPSREDGLFLAFIHPALKKSNPAVHPSSNHMCPSIISLCNSGNPLQSMCMPCFGLNKSLVCPHRPASAFRFIHSSMSESLHPDVRGDSRIGPGNLPLEISL